VHARCRGSNGLERGAAFLSDLAADAQQQDETRVDQPAPEGWRQRAGRNLAGESIVSLSVML
jgi:hypothetical protein